MVSKQVDSGTRHLNLGSSCSRNSCSGRVWDLDLSHLVFHLQRPSDAVGTSVSALARIGPQGRHVRCALTVKGVGTSLLKCRRPLLYATKEWWESGAAASWDTSATDNCQMSSAPKHLEKIKDSFPWSVPSDSLEVSCRVCVHSEVQTSGPHRQEREKRRTTLTAVHVRLSFAWLRMRDTPLRTGTKSGLASAFASSRVRGSASSSLSAASECRPQSPSAWPSLRSGTWLWRFSYENSFHHGPRGWMDQSLALS